MANKKLNELNQIAVIATGDQMLVSDISEAEGARSKYVTMTQLDSRFGAPLGATPVGEMTLVNNLTPTNIVTQNAWVKAIGFTPDNLNLFTFLDDALICGASGKYLFNGTLYGKRDSVGNDDFEVALFVNSTIVTKTTGRRNFSNVTGSLSTSVIINLAIDDVLEVFIRNITGTADFLPEILLVNAHGI